MAPTINPADWEWIKSRFNRLESLAPEARAPFLEQGRAERPDLAAILESILDAPTETFRLGPWTLRDNAERYAFAPGDVVASRYRVRSRVGAGGMGEVYEVEDTHMPERGALALKTVRGDLLGNAEIAARFEREVRHTLELAHPNVCRIYDVSRHTASSLATPNVSAGSAPSGTASRAGDILFLTMEFLSGGTLAAWMRGASGHPRAIPEAEALPPIRQMIAGLAAIHGQRIIHRDFKPLNVMLVPAGPGLRAVITDLGLARTVRGDFGGNDAGDTTLTRTGFSPGTPAYMAPEIITGAAAAGFASDVYSLGVTSFEMLTGNRTGLTEAAKGLKAAGVSPRLTAVIVKCLERDPAKRYSDASAVAAALDPRLALPRAQLKVAALVLFGLAIVSAGYFRWSNRAPAIPDQAAGWYRRGVEDVQSGAYYAGAKKFQEATRLAPDFTIAHVRLAEAWYSLDGHNLANAEMLKAVGKLNPEEEDYREGVRLILAGELDRAVSAFRAFASHAKDAHAAQLALALALDRAGHGPDARKIYASIAPDYPLASLRLARLDALGANWSQANPEFDAAIANFRKASNGEGETEAIYQRGLLNLQAVRLDDARQLLNQVLDRARSTGNAFQQVRALIDLSTAELRSGHTESAIALARQAMQAATDQRVELMYSRANRGLANAYTANGDYDKAEPLLREAVRLYREDSEDRLEAGALALLSDLHNRTGHFSEAAEEGEKALAYYSKQENPQLTVPAARTAATAYQNLGQFQRALELANQALAVATRAGNGGLTGEAQEALGLIELDRQHFAEAVSHLNLALDANTRAKSAISIPNESLDLGAALSALGRFAEAGNLFDSAEKLAQGRRDFVDSVRIERAQMEQYKGNQAAAARIVAGLPAGIPPDQSDPGEAAEVELVSGALASPQKAQALLKLNEDGFPFSLRRRIHFEVALALYRGHDSAQAAAALGAPGDYAELAELGWRALLLESRLDQGGGTPALRVQAMAALNAAAPSLGYTISAGYTISGRVISARADLRDELREMPVPMSSGK